MGDNYICDWHWPCSSDESGRCRSLECLNLPYKRKTAREKLATPHNLPEVKPAPEIWGGGTMVIPHPMQVMELMASIPEGQVATLDEVRTTLAGKNGADIACPMTSGIFMSMVAQASHEDKEEQGSFSVAYWRSLKRNGELNPKFPEGIEGQAKRLEAEGHSITHRGKKAFVEDFEKYLFQSL